MAMRRGRGSLGIEIAEVVEAIRRGIARARAIAMSPTRKPPMALAPSVRKRSDHLNLAITNAVRARDVRAPCYPYQRIPGIRHRAAAIASSLSDWSRRRA